MIEHVYDQAHLEALPDGTIISWLRIPGDPTSAAVAFVRVEVEDLGPCGPFDTSGNDCGTERTTWISPGGWDPQTPESAGITYPAQVVSYSLGLPPVMPLMPEPPEMPMLSGVLDHGGTWPREAALAAAAQVYQGQGMDRSSYAGIGALVKELAHDFELWLDRPTPQPAEPITAVDGKGERVPVGTCCCGTHRQLVCMPCSQGDHFQCLERR